MSGSTETRVVTCFIRHRVMQEAFAAQDATVHHAAGHLAGRQVLMLSRSGTVLNTLRHEDPMPAVVVAESRPACEGLLHMAEALAEHGHAATLWTDAAISTVIDQELVEAVVTGADAVLVTGDVVNKTGTRVAAQITGWITEQGMWSRDQVKRQAVTAR